MPTMPAAVDQTKYREVEFIGGRILQDRELQLFEDLERDAPTKGKYELGALFDTGAPLNVNAQIVGGTIRLLPVDTSKPMMVFVRGAFEAFTSTDAPAMVFTPQAAGVVNQLFLNYVVWRVTEDGAGGTTLEDPSLIDSGTGEATAEMGQLQVVIGADDHTSLDTGVMFDCNSVPVPMFSFTWQIDGSLQLTGITGFGGQAQASTMAPGVVKLSTATSKTAVSIDDPSVTNARAPLAASVTTASVKPIPSASPSTTTVSFLDQNGNTSTTTLAAVQTASTSGGIGAAASFYETWTCTVHDAIGFIWSKVVAAYAVLRSLGDRITALENAPVVSLAGHINQPLGPGVHPAVSATNFVANNCAFEVVDAAGTGAITGEIDNQGNYQLLRPDAQAAMTTLAGLCLNDFRTLAGAVATILNTPASPPSTAVTLGGDLSGESSDATVIQLQGRPVANTAPTEGQGLVFAGGAWTPETLEGISVARVSVPIAAPTNGVGAATMTYFIFTFGNTRVAFGNSQLRGGHVVPVPTSDWNSAVLAGSWGIVQATVSLGVLQSGGYGVQTYLDQNMTVVVNVWNAGSVFSVLNAQALGTYVNVNVIAISQDA
jgi:hypothetical protein